MIKKLHKAIALRASKICLEITEGKSEEEKILFALQNVKSLNNKAISAIAEDMCLARGTVTRWIELKNVPRQYEFDILKMIEEDIDYSSYTDLEKDQFFTPLSTVEKCYEIFSEKMAELGEDMGDYRFIEPSAGSGSFLSVLPENTIALDIEPRSDLVIEADYLNWEPEEGRYITFGNPPFGLRGNLALRFIKHSSKFSDFVCFILPQLFESDGKGSPRKRVEGLNLITSEVVSSKFNMPDGRETTVNVVFQIWAKNYDNEEYKLKSFSGSPVKVYSLSDGGTPSTTRNKEMHNACDFYLPSTCFGKNNMKIYSSFEDLPGRKGYGVVFKKNKDQLMKKAEKVDWSDVAFLSTNSAYNLRTSKILEVLS